ncbi:MAG: phytoene desaturase family protein [Methanomicrobiales archaeon]|nr:phytoene desaturase family protein [Methanomicrobiales archaeon]
MKAIVVGSGFGGLAASALLAKDGFSVTVLEKNEGPGGRASVYSEGGYHFDMGPSWYLMPDVYERFFAEFSRKPSDFYELKRLDPSYRIHFGNGKVADISPELGKNLELFESLEPGGAEKLKEYLESAREKYDLSINELLYRDYRSILDFLSGRLILEGRKLHVFESLDKFVSKYFRSDEAKKIVEYSIGFLGGSPKNTPAFYHIMSHIDLTLGVYYPVGGMRRVASAMKEMAESYGVEFRFNEPAKRIEIENRVARGVTTAQGAYDADLVIVNADYPYSELHLIEPRYQSYDERYWESRVLAPSAIVIYLGVDRVIEPLAHHTLFLDRNWENNFDEIFDPERAGWPKSPSYYVNVPSRTDPTAAPPGCDTLFILVALAPGIEDTPVLRERFYDKIMDHLEATTGEDIRHAIRVKRIFALKDFEERYNAYKGTALGLSHTLFQTALWRPAHQSKKVENLYYSGHYTHPGIGVPMTLISSTIVAREIRNKYL